MSGKIRREVVPWLLLMALVVLTLGFGASHFVTNPEKPKKSEVEFIKSSNFDPGPDFLNRGGDP